MVCRAVGVLLFVGRLTLPAAHCVCIHSFEWCDVMCRRCAYRELQLRASGGGLDESGRHGGLEHVAALLRAELEHHHQEVAHKVRSVDILTGPVVTHELHESMFCPSSLHGMGRDLLCLASLHGIGRDLLCLASLHGMGRDLLCLAPTFFLSPARPQ
jgi:hypothetical protein